MNSRTVAAVLLAATITLVVPTMSQAADVGGTWNMNAAGARFLVHIDQVGDILTTTEFQSAGDIGGIGLTFSSFVLWFNDLGTIYLGTVSGNLMVGNGFSLSAPGSFVWQAIRSS